MSKTEDKSAKRLFKAPMLPDMMAYMYASGRRVLDKVNIPRSKRRRYNPAHILLPEGYAAELVASGFNTPVHCTFGPDGYCYVTEAGYKVDALPRILKVDVDTGRYGVFFRLPEERWNQSGAVTGGCWHEGSFYFCNTDTLSRITPEGSFEDLVTELRGKGDHHVNYPIAGPDGKLYFGMGSATNAGVVGTDNYAYEWLRKFPDFHDLPAVDVTLAGHNYEFGNVVEGRLTEKVRTGAYSPFGRETRAGEVISGDVRCTGAVLRCNLDGSDLEVVAWGLRNPYGIAFHPDGRLFVTEHGIDERGARFIIGDYDDFYEVQQGAWYGWPDYASGVRLDDPRWGDGGRGREPPITDPPDAEPPRPVATFEPHAGANGFDFCRDDAFGFRGDAFVALFGDGAPITTRRSFPAGFKVVRVDMRTQRVVDFAVNKIAGGATALPHRGFERPCHCCFGPDGALYVVDWGQLVLAPEHGGVRMTAGTGALWRIRKVGDRGGEVPPQPTVLPVNAVLLALPVVAMVVIVASLLWLAIRLV